MFFIFLFLELVLYFLLCFVGIDYISFGSVKIVVYNVLFFLELYNLMSYSVMDIE